MFRKTLYCCIPLAFATLFSSLNETRGSAHPPDQAVALVENTIVEREITAGQNHSYQIALAQDRFLRVKADQRGIDIAITAFAPGGEKILTVDSAAGGRGRETAAIVAASPGNYRIEIKAPAQTSGQGRYALSVAELREATGKDRQQTAAERVFAEAEELRKAAQFEKAIEKYRESIPHWQAAGDLRGEADAVSTMGFAYSRLGQNQQALKEYERALRLCREAKDQGLDGDTRTAVGVIEGDTLNNLGLAYRVFGELEKALAHYLKALDVFRPLNERGREAITLGNIGGVYRLMGEPDNALTYFSQSLEMLRQEKDLPRVANALNSIGVVYAEKGESDRSSYNDAIERYDEALAIARQLNDKSREALALQNKGAGYRAMGRHGEALELLNQALKMRREMGRKREEAFALYEIGLVYEAMKQREEALENFVRAIDLAIQTDSVALRANALSAMARLERDRDNPVRARELIESALETIESMRAGIANPNLRASYLSLHRKSYDFYIDLLLRLHRAQPQAGYDALALKASESARARALLDNLSEIRADLRKGANSKLLERERQLQQSLNAKGAELIRMRVREPKSAKAIEDELAGLRRELQLVAGQIRVSNPAYYALAYQQPLGLEEIRQRALDADTMLLEYALGEDCSYLFVVTADRLRVFSLPNQKEIEKAASDFHGKIAARAVCQPFEEPREKLKRAKQSDAQAPRAAEELSRLIIEPAASELSAFKGKRLLIVGDGELIRIPFAALPLPKSARNPVDQNRVPPLLVRQFEIVQLPSASSLAILRDEVKARAAAPQEMVIFADPVFSADDPRVKSLNLALSQNKDKRTERQNEASGRGRRDAEDGDCGDGKLERLRATRKEANAIARLMPAARRKLALDFAADQKLVASETLGQYRYIHFATHGLLDRHPELSALALSMIDRNGHEQDGFLRLIEVFKLKLSADLVTLSACETGLGKHVKGEGMIGMTQGFFAAGAARVMVSLWKVDDEATARLMASFYHHLLRRRLSPAAALRQAQLEMIKQHPDQRSDLPPYFWAGFILQGEPK